MENNGTGLAFSVSLLFTVLEVLLVSLASISKMIKRLIHLWLKIQEIFPEEVANHVNKQVCLQDLQVRRELFPVFLTKGRLIYIITFTKMSFLAHLSRRLIGSAHR